jgi:hypothetical protein
MFNNLCRELDGWTKMQAKMQADRKQEDIKITCYSALVLERLFIYMFQEDFGALQQNLSLFHSTLSGKGPFSLEWWTSGIVE